MRNSKREEWIARQMEDVLNEARSLGMDPIEYVLARISADITAVRQMFESVVDERRRRNREGDEWKGD